MATMYSEDISEGASFVLYSYNNLKTVSYISGTATQGVDLEKIGTTGYGVYGSFRVQTFDDSIIEGTETFTLNGYDYSGRLSWIGNYRIIDNDKPNFIISLVDTSEAAPLGTRVGTITPSANATNGVIFSTSTPGFIVRGTGIFTTAPLDYELKPTSSISILARHTQSGVTNLQTSTLKLINADTEYVVSSKSTTAAEGGSGKVNPLSYVIARTGDTQGSQEISYAVTGVTSKDISSLSGQVVFGAGETSKTVTLQVIGNDEIQADRTATFTIVSPATVRDIVIKTASATTTIIDDDTKRSFNDIARDTAGAIVERLSDVSGITAKSAEAAALRAAQIADDLAGGLPSYVDDAQLLLAESRLRNFDETFRRINGSLDTYLGNLSERPANVLTVGTNWSASLLQQVLPAVEGLKAANEALDSGSSPDQAILQGVRSFSVAVLSGEVGAIAGGLAIGAATTLGAAPLAAIVVGGAVSFGIGWLAGQALNGAINVVTPADSMSGGTLRATLGVDTQALEEISAASVSIDGGAASVFTEMQVGQTVKTSWSYDPASGRFEWLDDATRWRFEAAAAALDLQKEVLGSIPDMVTTVPITDAEFEYFTAGAGKDSITGTLKRDIIAGKDGDDTILGMGGNDFVLAGVGKDIVKGGDGDDTLIGGEGADELWGGADNDTLSGQTGMDRLYGDDGDDILIGGADADFLSGGAGIDTVTYASSTSPINARLDPESSIYNTGEASGDTYDSIEVLIATSYNDVLIGDANANRLEGGAGADLLNGWGGIDALIGGDGDDYLVQFHQTSIVGSVFEGGMGNDTLQVAGKLDFTSATLLSIEKLQFNNEDQSIVNIKSDQIGGEGLSSNLYVVGDRYSNVIVIGMDSGNTIDLSGWTFSVVYYDGLVPSWSPALDVIMVHGASGNENIIGTSRVDALYGGAGNDTVNAGTGNDTLYGGDGLDRLNGGEGADEIFGEAGDDTLIGSEGGDILDGGVGFDYASYADARVGLTALLDAPSLNTSEAAGDTYVSIEGLVGSAYDDNLQGDAGSNVLYGQAGNDTLLGLDGNDQLIGGAGADVLDGGAGYDQVLYVNSTRGIIADLSAPATANTGDAAGDTYIGIEGLGGSQFADLLIGGATSTLNGFGGDDNLVGGSLGDYLFGDDGNDNLYGGGSGDYLSGGTGFDAARYDNATSGVTAVLINSGFNAGTDAAGDLYVGIEAVVGSAFNDVLIGDDGNNLIAGQGGNDFLDGYAGNDTLYGGAGADIFSFKAGTGNDVVGDFTPAGSAHDTILIGSNVNGSGIVDYASLQSHLSQNGADVLIDLGAGNSVLLQNVQLAQLTAADFAFG